MLYNEFCERSQRPRPVIARHMRIDRRRVEQLPRAIDDRHFDAGPKTGVEAHRGARPSRRSEQEVVQVSCEDSDGLLFRALAQG